MSSTHKTTITLDIDGHDVETSIELHYEWREGSYGCRENHTGLQLEPDYAPYVNFTGASVCINQDVKVAADWLLDLYSEDQLYQLGWEIIGDWI